MTAKTLIDTDAQPGDLRPIIQTLFDATYRMEAAFRCVLSADMAGHVIGFDQRMMLEAGLIASHLTMDKLSELEGQLAMESHEQEWIDGYAVDGVTAYRHAVGEGQWDIMKMIGLPASSSG
ncbi:hypothetical protein [Sulfuriflexus sp.]|uniref:hypothetical protein n=1 Tax=Sulfuriflexus sp. TaxID=2015443 RepID=UPI0028CE31C5|nr:hypothetical protein [Sulfuriflexus sp.]MDT8405476.1 hypothetical protein [Sulfuriflexus sp.]